MARAGQVDLLRAATPAQRVARARAMSAAVVGLLERLRVERALAAAARA